MVLTNVLLDGQCIVNQEGFQHVILNWPPFLPPPNVLLDGQCIVNQEGFQHVILNWPPFLPPPCPHI